MKKKKSSKKTTKKEKVVRYDWNKLFQEFLFSEFVSVKDFLVSKWILEENKRLSGAMQTKTKGWAEEKKKFWQEKLENFELDEKQKQIFGIAIYQGVDVFADMLIYYAKKQREKIKKWDKGIYVEELLKFWKLLEYYHKLKLWTEFETTININNQANNDPLADLLPKLENVK